MGSCGPGKGEGRAPGWTTKFKSLAIKYKHAMFLRWGRGEGSIREGLSWGGAMGVLLRPAVHPSHPDPFPLCLWVHVCVGLCALPQSPPCLAPTPHPPPLIAAIPVAAGCHSSAHHLQRGQRGGWEGEHPPASLPRPPLPPLPEVPAVV